MTTSVAPSSPSAEPRKYRWTRPEYHRAAEGGEFQGKRVQLIGGEIVEMAPMNNSHAVAIGLAPIELQKAFGSGAWVRVQLPLLGQDDSESEPDLSVVRGEPRSFKDHPASALLVIEISDSSLAFDRGEKASLYASSGITDYWIVNLIDRRLEVHRDPIPDKSQRFASRYASVTPYNPGATIAPLAAQASPIAVNDLLP